jgi:hypothetical protein
MTTHFQSEELVTPVSVQARAKSVTACAEQTEMAATCRRQSNKLAIPERLGQADPRSDSVIQM